MIRAITNILCYNKENVDLLKHTDSLAPFYEFVGFKRITGVSKWLNIVDVVRHYEEIQAAKRLHSYILKSNIDIDHNLIKFVNLIKQSLDDIDFKIKGNTLIAADIHRIFVSDSKYQTMKASCSPNDIFIKNYKFSHFHRFYSHVTSILVIRST